ADASETRSIEHNHSLVADLEFDRSLGSDSLRKCDDGLGQSARVVNVGGVGVGNELQWLVVASDRTPVEGRRDLQHRDLLRALRIVSKRDLAANSQTLLLGVHLDIQVIVGEGEGFAVKRKRIYHRGTEKTEKSQTHQPILHSAP